MFKKTAIALWQEEFSAQSIITSCIELDAALSNGIPTGVITEFCGPPGSGKTQLCLQLCLNVQISSDVGGMDGEAVFVDTNRGFSPYRFREIAIAQSRKLFNSSPLTQSLIDKFLNGVKMYFVSDYEQLLAVIYNFENVLAENSRIRLIVIDSISYLFRQMKHAEGDTIRTQILYELMTILQQLADQFHCAIVLTNELTTRMVETNNASTLLVPSMGDSYSHRVTQLITLACEDVRSDVFCANIDKSLYSPEIIVKFKITADGVRSV